MEGVRCCHGYCDLSFTLAGDLCTSLHPVWAMLGQSWDCREDGMLVPCGAGLSFSCLPPALVKLLARSLLLSFLSHRMDMVAWELPWNGEFGTKVQACHCC